MAEDFTTYTEVDPQGWMTVTTDKADVVDADRANDCYLYKDFGANYFNFLSIKFEIYVASATETSGSGGVAIANVADKMGNFGSTDLSVLGVRKTAGGIYTIYLFRGVAAAEDLYDVNPDTLYYCTVNRAADSDTVTVGIYSDSGRTNLLDTLSLAGFGTATKWQYCYGFTNFNNDRAAGFFLFTGYVQNLSIGRASSETAGLYAVVEERFHYVDAYGVERFIQGEAV